MEKKLEEIKHAFLDLVSTNKDVLFYSGHTRNVKKKQEVWKAIHAKMVGKKLINFNKDWKWTRRQWYYLTQLARRSREQFLLGKIYDIPEFDKKLLAISGIPIPINDEQASYAVERLNAENERGFSSSTINVLDNLEITEHKFSVEDVKSKELSEKREIDLLNRKLEEQKFILQQLELLKRKHEISNIKNKKGREKFMKLL